MTQTPNHKGPKLSGGMYLFMSGCTLLFGLSSGSWFMALLSIAFAVGCAVEWFKGSARK